jgi:hypothetical protein
LVSLNLKFTSTGVKRCSEENWFSQWLDNEHRLNLKAESSLAMLASLFDGSRCHPNTLEAGLVLPNCILDKAADLLNGTAFSNFNALQIWKPIVRERASDLMIFIRNFIQPTRRVKKVAEIPAETLLQGLKNGSPLPPPFLLRGWIVVKQAIKYTEPQCFFTHDRFVTVQRKCPEKSGDKKNQVYNERELAGFGIGLPSRDTAAATPEHV